MATIDLLTWKTVDLGLIVKKDFGRDDSCGLLHSYTDDSFKILGPGLKGLWVGRSSGTSGSRYSGSAAAAR